MNNERHDYGCDICGERKDFESGINWLSSYFGICDCCREKYTNTEIARYFSRNDNIDKSSDMMWLFQFLIEWNEPAFDPERSFEEQAKELVFSVEDVDWFEEDYTREIRAKKAVHEFVRIR